MDGARVEAAVARLMMALDPCVPWECLVASTAPSGAVEAALSS